MSGSHTQEHDTAENVNYAALSERVSGLTRDVHSVQKDIGDIRSAMPSAAAVRDIAAKLEGLSSKLEERNKTQWPTLIAAGGFLLAFMIAIGAMAYDPIKATLALHSLDIRDMRAQYVTDLKDQIRFLRMQ